MSFEYWMKYCAHLTSDIHFKNLAFLEKSETGFWKWFPIKYVLYVYFQPSNFKQKIHYHNYIFTSFGFLYPSLRNLLHPYFPPSLLRTSSLVFLRTWTSSTAKAGKPTTVNNDASVSFDNDSRGSIDCNWLILLQSWAWPKIYVQGRDKEKTDSSAFTYANIIWKFSELF